MPTESPGSGLAGAVQFLTRVPVRTAGAVPPARIVGWFPVVGAAIGALVGAVAAGLGHWGSPGVGAAVAVAVGMAVTGAFHEDGLADVADAMAGGTTLERRLEILKDPRHGTYGVAALATSVAVRIAALAALGPAAAFAGAVAAHTTGRAAATAVIGRRRPAFAERPGLGSTMSTDLPHRGPAAGLAAAAAIATVAIGWWVLPVIAVAGVATAIVIGLAERAFGAVSGDVLGTIEQIVEMTTLVTVVVLAAHSSLWWR